MALLIKRRDSSNIWLFFHVWVIADLFWVSQYILSNNYTYIDKTKRIYSIQIKNALGLLKVLSHVYKMLNWWLGIIAILKFNLLMKMHIKRWWEYKSGVLAKFYYQSSIFKGLIKVNPKSKWDRRK